MNRCDWTDCALEVGLFDGMPSSLLNPEAHKNIPVTKNRFISLCPKHFELGITFKPATVRTDYASEIINHSLGAAFNSVARFSEKFQHLLFG